MEKRQKESNRNTMISYVKKPIRRVILEWAVVLGLARKQEPMKNCIS